MLLTFGILLILVGILNLLNYAISLGEVSGFWGIFGVFQIIWGIQEINRFRRTKENPKYDIKEKNKIGFVWHGLRFGFTVMAGCWILNIFLLRIFFALGAAIIMILSAFWLPIKGNQEWVIRQGVIFGSLFWFCLLIKRRNLIF